MRIIYLVGGLLSLCLGVLGALLPLLPSFPFLVLSAFCFTRSNERLYHWLIHTSMYKKIVVPFKDEKKMTMKNKIGIMVLVTLLMSVGFVMMHEVVVGQMVLVCVWLFHLYYFIFRIKTQKY